MPSYIFDTMLTKGVRAGQIPARTQAARQWYRDTAQEMSRVNQSQIFKGAGERLTSRILSISHQPL